MLLLLSAMSVGFESRTGIEATLIGSDGTPSPSTTNSATALPEDSDGSETKDKLHSGVDEAVEQAMQVMLEDVPPVPPPATDAPPQPTERIDSFEACVRAGNPVMESYPRQCRSVDGALFVEMVANITTDTGHIETDATTLVAPQQADASAVFSRNSTSHTADGTVGTSVAPAVSERTDTERAIPSSVHDEFNVTARKKALERMTDDVHMHLGDVRTRVVYEVPRGGPGAEEQERRMLSAALVERESSELRDMDGDGITDFDELHIYNTNPHNARSSGGVLTDGERLLLGLDPNGTGVEPSPIEDVRFVGLEPDTTFIVTRIEATTLRQEEQQGSSVSSEGTDTVGVVPPLGATGAGLIIAGFARPLSFVTLYIYSTPVVVTVRTDELGRFEYELAVALENGEHEVRLATVNNAGKVLAKSEPIYFVKQAEAIEFTPVTVTSTGDVISQTKQLFIVLGTAVLILLAGLAVLVLGVFRTRSAEHVNELHSNNDG